MKKECTVKDVKHFIADMNICSGDEGYSCIMALYITECVDCKYYLCSPLNNCFICACNKYNKFLR